MEDLVVDNFSEITIDLVFRKDDDLDLNNEENTTLRPVHIKGESDDGSNHVLDCATDKRNTDNSDSSNIDINKTELSVEDNKQQTEEQFEEIKF